MNTAFFLNLKNRFLNYYTKNMRTLNAQIRGFIVIAFASVLIAGCGNNSNDKKTTTDTLTNTGTAPHGDDMRDDSANNGNMRMDDDKDAMAR